MSNIKLDLLRWRRASEPATSLLLLICWVLAAFPVCMDAHPMPNSLVDLKVSTNELIFKIQMPLSDFETAYRQAFDKSDTQRLAQYFSEHLKIQGSNGQFWEMELQNTQIEEIQDPLIGTYTELNITLSGVPQGDKRQFVLFYDVIMHQIVTHQAIIHITQDWENGINEQPQKLAVVQVDTESGKIYPVAINLEKGSAWTGFKAMVQLGTEHIAKGADHLLFLMMLLLVAPLVLSGSRWGGFGGVRYSLLRLLKMVTAFTIGHSLTLAVCSLQWISFSSRWIEVLIAVSILVSAVHAIFPLFFGREIWVATAFGLIHGMAFSNTLSILELDNKQLFISILGFNIGIELMQIFIVACVIPFLIILSKSAYYTWFKNSIAGLGLLASLAWMIQRISNTNNVLASFMDNLVEYPYWLIGGLVAVTLVVTGLKNKE